MNTPSPYSESLEQFPRRAVRILLAPGPYSAALETSPEGKARVDALQNLVGRETSTDGRRVFVDKEPDGSFSITYVAFGDNSVRALILIDGLTGKPHFAAADTAEQSRMNQDCHGQEEKMVDGVIRALSEA